MADPATQQRPIIQLSKQLANQIAAGEVVERPASVVKELVENSLDAGATQIDIEIINGGKQLIRIRDNGTGIAKDQLSLALSPHATSKIVSLDDLQSLASFGFRGEALASISSVSRFRLTSRTESQQRGWCAITTGDEMQVTLSPAPATVGTRIDVEELFHNTPARRRFLRTDKTELSQIETVVRQVALAHPAVTITLKHNQRVLKRYKAAHDLPQTEQRLAVVCGKDFVRQSVRISVDHDQLSLTGWIGLPEYHRSQTDGQYFFVNNRPVKDKVLNHAIREAYYPHLPEGRSAAYVLFLELPASQVDVNVHPTKHEVRFHQVRQVHDFIVQALEQSLHQGIALVDEETNRREIAESTAHNYRNDIRDNDEQKYSSYSDFIRSAYRHNAGDQSAERLATGETQSILVLDNQRLLLVQDTTVVFMRLDALFDFWLALAAPDGTSNKLLFPQHVVTNQVESLQRLSEEFALELHDQQRQFKILSAPANWQLPYLHRIIEDYLHFTQDQPEQLRLDWVTDFIARYDCGDIQLTRSIQELEEYFSGSA